MSSGGTWGPRGGWLSREGDGPGPGRGWAMLRRVGVGGTGPTIKQQERMPDCLLGGPIINGSSVLCWLIDQPGEERAHWRLRC
jgi:hypothetical protein